MTITVSDRSQAKHAIAKIVVESSEKYCAFKVQKADWATRNKAIQHAVYTLWPR